MNYLFSVLSVFVSLNVFAASKSNIILKVEGGSSIQIAWLGTEPDASEVELAWENGGQEAIMVGDFCYNGKVEEIVQLLQALSDGDFLGDEYRMKRISTKKAGQISYQVYDGPNEEYFDRVTVTSCR